MPLSRSPSSSRPAPSGGDAIPARLRAAGLRVTAQRVAILDVLLRMGGHPTADEIFRAVRRRFPMLSLNTVYKTLNALCARGELTTVGNGDEGAVRFEGNPFPHHHAICRGCRQIQDVLDPALDTLQALPRLRRDFLVTGHRVEFFGYCRACREAGRTEANAPSRPRTVPRGRAGESA